MTKTPLLEVHHVSHHFKLGRRRWLPAVNKVSLTIFENEVLGLVGESGSGKSTLGKVIIGLLEKTTGHVLYRQKQLPRTYKHSDYQYYAARMQMIFQDPYSSLNPHMTAAEIIAEGLILTQQLTKVEILEQVSSWLRQVGLSPDHMLRYPHEFSGGQRQRIGVARAMIMAPEFVICDEPMSALDVSVQAQVVNLLRKLQQTMGLTMLFIAHDLSMVRYISDRIAVFYLGNLVEIGDAEELYSQPLHPYAQLLIQSSPEPDPQHERHRQVLTTGELAHQSSDMIGCCFAHRCPEALASCQRLRPELIPVHEEGCTERWVACHLYKPGDKLR